MGSGRSEICLRYFPLPRAGANDREHLCGAGALRILPLKGGMPLTVYADILAIVNLYIDFFLLWCVKKFLGLRVKNRRLVLGAFAGAACSLTALLPIEAPWLSLVLGLAVSFAVAAAAFAPLQIRAFFRAALCFWAFTLLLAGFFLFLLRFFAPRRVAVLGNVVYFDLSPVLLFLFTCGAYLVFALVRRLFSAGAQAAGCRWLVVENDGKKIRLYAKADTGNALREPFSGLPVIVCQADGLGDAAPKIIQEFLAAGSAPDSPEAAAGLRLVPFETVGGGGVLPAFRPQKVTVEKTGAVLDCWLAVCRQRLSAGQFDALYNPDLFAH